MHGLTWITYHMEPVHLRVYINFVVHYKTKQSFALQFHADDSWSTWIISVPIFQSRSLSTSVRHNYPSLPFRIHDKSPLGAIFILISRFNVLIIPQPSIQNSYIIQLYSVSKQSRHGHIEWSIQPHSCVWDECAYILRFEVSKLFIVVGTRITYKPSKCQE